MFRFRSARLWRAGSIFCGSLPGIPVFAWTAAGYWIPHAQRHSCSPKVPFSRCPKGPQWPPRAMQALANTRATQEHPPLGAQLLPCPLEVNCFDEGPKCCSYNPGIQYSLEQEMIQNRASEIQNTLPIILEIWIYVRISKFSTAILENMIYPNRTSVKTAHANFEILFGYH